MIKDIERHQTLESRVVELEEALLHLLEVQNAPSFNKGSDPELYAKQSKEWTEAVHDARAVLRNA